MYIDLRQRIERIYTETNRKNLHINQKLTILGTCRTKRRGQAKGNWWGMYNPNLPTKKTPLELSLVYSS